MNRVPTLAVGLLALLLVAPSLAAVDLHGEVQVQQLEATSSGSTTGTFVGLLIGRPGSSTLPDPAFTLTTPDSAITAYNAPVWASDFDVAAQEQPVHKGPATVEGLEARPDFHLWVTPLGDELPTVRLDHQACTNFQNPEDDTETRVHEVDRARPDVTVDTRGAVDVASCAEANAVIEGDLTLTVWEWDVRINDERHDTGVNDTTANTGLIGSGAGSASELTIQARSATLTIPLSPAVYELFIAQPDLQASELRLSRAEGTLPGLLEPATGQDVELKGDYAVSVTAQGSEQPLAAVVSGITDAATADGEPLDLQVPAPPSARSPVAWIVTAASVVLVLALAWNAARPWRVYCALQGYSGEVRGDGEPRTVRERMAAGLYLMADRDVEQGRFRRAIWRGRLSLVWSRNYSSAAFITAGALSGLKRHAEALAFFQKSEAWARTPKWRALALMGAAEVELRSGHVEAAIPLALRGRREHPRIAAQVARGAAWNGLETSHAGFLAALRSGSSPGDENSYVT